MTDVLLTGISTLITWSKAPTSWAMDGSQVDTPTAQLEARATARGWLLMMPPSDTNVKAVLLLFGWWRSKLSNLCKYGQWYLSNGCAVVCVPQSYLSLEFGGSHLMEHAVELRYLLHALRDCTAIVWHTHPVLIAHAFSNGGLVHLYHTLHDMAGTLLVVSWFRAWTR